MAAALLEDVDALRSQIYLLRQAIDRPFDRPMLYSERPFRNPSIVGAGTPGTNGIVPAMIAVSPPNLDNIDFKIGVASALGGAQAYVDDSVLRIGGGLTIAALETATIRATDLSTVVSSGGSKLGNSIAVNGLIASNLVLSEANAFISDSDVLTRGGDIVLDAQNTSTISAEITSDTRSKGVSIGVTLAFNTIGYQAQNILFDLVDSLFGTELADKLPAKVSAYIDNSEVVSAGALSLSAVSDAAIEAKILNSATSIAVAPNDTWQISVGAVVALNKISTLVQAFIDDSASAVANDGDIVLAASDESVITSHVAVASLSLAVSTGYAGAVSVGVSISRNEIDNEVAAFVRDVDEVSSVDGSVRVLAGEVANIEATSTASAISPAGA